MNKRANTVVTVTTVAVLCVSLLAAWSGQDRPRNQMGFPDLVGGLKASPGCVGVETAQTQSGKQVIFAWFQDKPAVRKWYYGDVHQGVMDTLATGNQYARTKPLEHVADDAGPILVVASITPSAAPQFPNLDIPVSQIAIELYEALPGGAFLGARFAPDAVKVDHMRDYTPTPGGSSP